MSCFADDMCLFVRDLSSGKSALNILKNFESCSSLKINHHKTEAMWVGSAIHYVCKPRDVQWTKKLRVLGIYFTYNDNEFYGLNCNDKLKSLERIINMWGQRDLSVIGKITIMNTFGLSTLFYNSTMIGMPLHIQKNVNLYGVQIHLEWPSQS